MQGARIHPRPDHRGLKMAEIKVGDVTFNVSVEGPEGAPALLVGHSLGADLTQWDPQMPSLARRFRVIRYDSRGHGFTEPTPGPYSIDQLGADALAILDSLGVDKAHFLGLSLGGLVGMWLMVNAPDRVDRVILSNTNACFGHADVWNSRIRQVLAEGMDSIAAGTMDRWFTREFQEKEPAEIDRISARLRATPAEAYAATAAALRDADLREAIRGVKNRVLVIVGTQDPATPPSAGGLIAEHIPGARLVALEAAHLSNIEAANDFTRAIVSFLTAPATVAKPAKTAGRKAAKKPAAAEAPKKAAKAQARKAAKKAAKKTVKKAAKKTAKKAAKKPTKKAAGKPAKKATKTSAPKAAKKPAAKAAKKTGKKTAKQTGKQTAKKPAGKVAKKAAAKAARSPAKKAATKPARTAARKPARKATKARR